MRTDLELISDEKDYVIVRDVRIPFAMNNIIFRMSALKVIANYYYEKYGVIIQVASCYSKIDKLVDNIYTLLNHAKQKFPTAQQMGFIFISDDDPDDIYGHALPMIWQKDNHEEHLFFLDTTQYLGGLSQQRSIDFRCRLKVMMPQLQLWGIVGGRQRDYSSCYTDALVMLKDGLRASSFKALVERKLNSVLSTSLLKIFFAPEKLLKTAQIHSYVETSGANLDEVICHRFQKDADRQSSGVAIPVTLVAFRRQYDLPVQVNAHQKKLFGTYTLFKTERYLRILHEQKEKEEFAYITHEFKSGSRRG